MKSLLTAFLLLTSVQTYAQVRTGTGPDANIESFQITESLLTADLSTQSLQCGTKRMKYYQSLLDFYFQQNTSQQIKQLKKVEPKVVCLDAKVEASEEIQCLFNTQDTYLKLKKLLDDKQIFEQYYVNFHNLSAKEAEALFNYFKLLDKELSPNGKKHK